LEPRQERAWGQHPNARRRQLEGQRQALEPLADGGHVVRVFRGQLEATTWSNSNRLESGRRAGAPPRTTSCSSRNRRRPRYSAANPDALAQFHLEIDNLRAALTWSRDQPGLADDLGPQVAGRLAGTGVCVAVFARAERGRRRFSHKAPG